MQKLKCVVFDMDGVIADTEPVHISIMEGLLDELHVKRMDISKNVGKPLWQFWENVIAENGLCGVTAPEIVARQYKVTLDWIRENRLPPSLGLLELLDSLRQNGVRCAVASSSGRELVLGVLSLLGIAGYFEAVVTGEDVKNKKPDPESYQLALKRLSANVANTAAIEDSKSGVTAALAAGLFTIGYQNKTSGNQDISAADRVVDNLAQAQAILEHFYIGEHLLP